MGKIKGIYFMDTKNAEDNTRGEEEKCNVLSLPGGDEVIRGESTSAGNQQKRIYRANSTSREFDAQTSITGGILSQLINDYYDQLAEKTNQIHRIEEERQRLELEKERIKADREKLQGKIQEFTTLQQELKKQPEQPE
jgi:chromosome segregation ATPase